MNRSRIASIIVAIVALSLTAAFGQLGGPEGGLDIAWHSIDGGGGTSTGSGFELVGTIGQHDAGPAMTGGPPENEFSLAGGVRPGAGIPPVPACPPDVTGDGVVGVGDLLAVITNWGAVTPPNPADINDDGVVGVADLLAVISAWGACPLP